MTAPALSVQGLSARLGGRPVLSDVTLSAGEGERVSVVGPNGAGKTTLLKCVIGLVRPSAGEVRLAGRPASAMTRREIARAVAYVPQADGRAVPFTVREFVMMGRYPHLSPFTAPAKADFDAVDRAMELAGVAAFAERALVTLSGGEAQAAFVAAALAEEAPLLLLDEPATFLDPKHHAEVTEVLARAARATGAATVTVTHDVNAAALASDRVVALRDGRVVFHGAPRELMREEVLEEVYGRRFLLVEHPTAGIPVVMPEGAAR